MSSVQKNSHSFAAVPRARWTDSYGIRLALAVALAIFLLRLTPTWPSLPEHMFPVNGQESQTSEFDWLKVRPLDKLVWHPCFEGQQCARLSVPINWNDTSNPARVALAIIKTPAKVPVTDFRYGGAIVMNPGGPGNSGVYQIRSGGKHVQTIVDSPLNPSGAARAGKEGKYFDIIGFDPRAVANTTPHMKCFPNRQAETIWLATEVSEFTWAASDISFDLAWARNKAAGRSCAVKHGDEPNIAQFANTAQVVEDIVAIIERHGEWREAEAQRLLSCPKKRAALGAEAHKMLERTRWHRGAELLNYWGFSYGTLLGQTFATMHPERVGRVIIDGVVDAEDYYKMNWLTNLQDTDQILHQWADYCMAAGEKCPMSVPGDMPAGVVTARVARYMGLLLERPLEIPANDVRGPMAIGYDDLASIGRLAYYEPHQMAERFFDLVRGVATGNVTELVRLSEKDEVPLVLSADCLKDGPFSDACVRTQDSQWAGAAIRCGDGDDLRNETKDEFKDYVTTLQRQSSLFGTAWSTIRLGCIGWDSRPKWKPDGPIQGKTANPLFIIGNTYDPVTPLQNAHRASTLFPGSVVLQQNTEGHCTYSSPSLCTARAIRKYYEDGTFPSEGIICQPEVRPWLGCVSPSGCENRSPEDELLWKALDSLAAVWPSPPKK